MVKHRYDFVLNNRLVLKNILVLAIILFVVANLFFGNVVLAKKIEINEKEVEIIKGSLDFTKIFINIVLDNDGLKTFLNTVIKGGEISTDLTYGLLVLSAVNELEFIDLVVSQRYKTEARDYFNQILDERLNLISYWKGVGFDLPRILSGKITGPMAALTLNTFSMSNEVVRIFMTFENLKDVKMYNGLWAYFDQRRYNTSHKEAWSDAKDFMGWAIRGGLSIRLKDGPDEKVEAQIEAQFSALWDTWGPYVEPFGISEEAKTQVRSDLQDTLVLGIESYETKPSLAKPSLTATVKQTWNSLINQLRNIEDDIKKLAQEINIQTQAVLNVVKTAFSKLALFSPATVVQTQPTKDEALELLTITETEEGLITQSTQASDSAKLSLAEEKEPVKLSLADLQEELDDILEMVDVINQEVSELSPTKDDDENTPSQEENVEVTEETEEELEDEEMAEAIETAFILCDKTSEPTRNKVIFYEIAWMGTLNSVNDEWIELKNISGAQVDLTGWQLMDADEQINIVFKEKVVLANQILLLERTDDNSVPLATADLIYTGSLGNSDEALYLFDENCQLQDRVLASPEWLAGENNTKRTMERRPDLSWQSSWEAGGTPGKETGVGYVKAPAGGGASGGSQSPPPVAEEPEITLNFPSQNPANEEIQVELSASSLENADYDVKIFIEDEETIISEIYNPSEEKWQSSFYYIGAAVAGPSFQNESFRLKIKNEKADFRGEADITVKLRETGQSGYIEFIDRIQISEPSASSTNQLPTASFVVSPATSTVGEAIIFNAASSTDSDGTITSYIWDFGDNTTSTEIKATTTHNYSISSDFLVSLIVIDNNNATNSATTTIAITTPEPSTLEVVINEIQIDGIEGAGGAEDDWVELYNPADEDISLAGWSIQRHTPSGETLGKKNFEPTHIIPAKGYFLIVRNEANDNLKMIADMTCSALQLSSSSTVYLVSNDEYIESGDDPDIVDKVGFGQGAFSPEGNPASDPPEAQSIERKELGLDTDDNSQDFIINENPSPTNSKGETGPTLLTNYQVTQDFTFSIQGSPYIIQGGLTINGGKTLTVEPGVSLKFNKNASLEVNGTIIAIGEEYKKIVLTSSIEPNYWRGIYFASSSENSLLEYCQVKYAGYPNPDIDKDYLAIRVDSTSIGFENSIMENINGTGIKLINSSSTIDNLIIKNAIVGAVKILGGEPEIKDSRFIDTGAGMFIGEGSRAKIIGNYFELKAVSPLESVLVNNSYPVLKNNQGTSTNALNGIYLSGTVSEDWQLGKNEDFPYIISSLTNSASTTLEIEPGAVVKFKQGGELEIDGTLKAEGTEEEKILFTSLSGYDGRIYFSPESSRSILKNVILERGHSSGMVYVASSSVDFQKTEFRDINIGLVLENSSSTVSNCVFDDNKAISIKVNGGNPFIKNSVFQNGNVAIKLENNSQGLIENNSFEGFRYSQGVINVRNSHPLLRENSGQDNEVNGIYLFGTVSNDWTLYRNEMPYVIDVLEVANGKTLEIEAGAVIQIVPPSAYSGAGWIEINGALKAIGEENNKIIFTSLNPTSRWDTIRFTSEEATSTLKYVVIQYGGKSSTPTKGALSVENARVEFRNLLFDGNYYSLYFNNSSSSVISDSEFTSCQRGILIEGDCPEITNLTLNCTCNFASPSISCSTTASSICQ